MASRKRGRGTVRAEEHPSTKRTARGASPQPIIYAKVDPLSAFNNYQFSYPTIPEPYHFLSSPEASATQENRNFSTAQHNSSEQDLGRNFSDTMHPNINHNNSAHGSSQTSSSHPNSSHISNRYKPEDWKIDDAMSECIDKMCFDDCCPARECPSCDSTCYEPCMNPEECSSITCRNLSCHGSPLPTCPDHHTPAAELFGDAENNRLYCDWLGNGVNCDQSESDKNQLGAHVTESHIKPQAHITCEWDSCGMETDLRQLPKHLWADHEPASYVCLWSSCEQKFSTHEELDEHFKLVHCHIGCHWAGCEMVTMSQFELQKHFNEEHLMLHNKYEASGSSLDTDSSVDPADPSEAPSSSASAAFHISDSSKTSLLSTKSNDHLETKMLGPKMCKWVTSGRSNELCRSIHNHGNSLFEHVRNEHNPPANSKSLKCGWDGCNYNESSGDRSKLWRHVAIHTRCKSASLHSTAEA